MKLSRFVLLLLTSLLMLGAGSAVLAQQSAVTYAFQVHPIFTPRQAELVYQPLVDYLNVTTEYRFELRTSRDFHSYWLEIRRGQRPDLVLEDAHLIAFRMQRDGFVPLVRAADPASFSLLTADGSAGGPEDFIGRRVSSMPSPSLGYLVLASWFTNPMQQPVVESSAASWLDAVEIVFDAEAEAAIVPHHLVRRYVNLDPVATSTEFPHLTIAASADLPESVRLAVQQTLLEISEEPEFFGVLHELDIEAFVTANADEYVGLERWLEHVVTGL